MQRITIGRYKPVPAEAVQNLSANAQATVVDVASLYDGWIEGTRDDGTNWIMWLDASGSPEVFWARRDQDGGVEGEAINLTPSRLTEPPK